jgi:hypothetical protein
VHRRPPLGATSAQQECCVEQILELFQEGDSSRMASVLSVNVGLPHDVEWQGKTIRTAIWKRPVPGRVFAGRLNLTAIGDFLAP